MGINARDYAASLDFDALYRPAAAFPTMTGVPFEPHPVVRVGMIGLGGRGMSLMGDLLALDGVRITAVCDIVPERVMAAQRRVEAAGQPTPAAYDKSEVEFDKLADRDDVDIIYVATPWRWHVPMALSAMQSGKHVAVEVPAATTLRDCWQLVNLSEESRRHCILLENCCYGYNELLVLNMVRAGLFGELTHAAAAYHHDLRRLLFEDQGEATWRRFEHMNRNGNLYPTHGLGPVARYLGIDRGDRFDYLVSMSSPERSLSEYAREHLPEDDTRRQERYICGDINISLIKTARGLTITLEHNTVTPQPYDRVNMIAGTKGIFRDYPPRIYLDGQPGGEKFVGLDDYKAEWESALWREVGTRSVGGGHGGMDFVMNYRLIQCMRDGLPPDIDVYDAAAWSAPTPLSELSVERGSTPVKFPDFTRGRWTEKV